MKDSIPRTPFSTPLSGSAREVELRLRNIFSGPKKRPPLPFLALMFAVCLLCGNLVSCQEAEAELPPPDLSLAPVDWEKLSYPDPLYTVEDNGNVRIENLGDAVAEWSRRPPKSFLYFAGDISFCCPSLAGRVAEANAQWQAEEGDAISVDISVNDDRLEYGTIDGFSIHFTADWFREEILETSFTSDIGDGALELSEEEIYYASRVLDRLMNGAEWTATADVPVFDAAPDLNRNGVPEELRLIVPAEYGSGQQLEVWEDGRRIFMEQGDQVHAGYNAIFLCTLDGEDYLLRYNPYMGQWVAGYHYWLFTLEGDAEKVVRQNELYFDINFGYPAPDSGIRDPDEFFDPEEINAFMEEINGLLSHSVQLLNTDQELLSTFEKEGRLEDTLWFLDAWEPIFRRDPNRSLLENLYDFRDAMVADIQWAE